MNPYLARKARQGIGVAGRKSEKKTARRLGLKQTPASGAAIAKGDLRNDRVLMEAKATVHDSLAIKLEWLIKIAGEAASTGKEPALAITFTNQQGAPRKHGAWVCVPEALWTELQLSARSEQ